MLERSEFMLFGIVFAMLMRLYVEICWTIDDCHCMAYCVTGLV